MSEQWIDLDLNEFPHDGLTKERRWRRRIIGGPAVTAGWIEFAHPCVLELCDINLVLTKLAIYQYLDNSEMKKRNYSKTGLQKHVEGMGNNKESFIPFQPCESEKEHKMDINFIKWMLNYAGWRTFRDDDGEVHFYYHPTSKRYWYSVSMLETDIALWPLLLQKAIEGINKKSDDFYIENHLRDVSVNTEEPDCVYFRIDDNPDQAKKSALYHVYILETS